MNKAIEQDLLALLPSLTGSLPRELVHLAASLLAQSRSKASSLKPEEEIARGYACAHLACDRLRMDLNLPAVKPRPPVPPRAYKKIFGYISSALNHEQSQSRPQSAANTPSRTPSKRKFDALQRTPQSSPSKTPISLVKRSTKKQPATQDEEDHVPSWTMSAIRSVCKALGMPYAAPHVFTGVSSIVRLQSDRSKEAQAPVVTPSRKRSRRSGATYAESEARSLEINELTIPSLIVCVALMTTAELSAETPTDREVSQQKDLAIQALHGAVPEDVARHSAVWSADVASLQEMAVQAGWTGMQWYLNIEPPEVQETSAANHADREEHFEGKAGSSPVNLRVLFGNVKAGTIDWLSEERKAHYVTWRADIMARLKNVEVQAAI